MAMLSSMAISPISPRRATAVLVEVSVHRFIRSLTFSAIFAVSAGASAKAQDAEFGCKVLLCAAATNPSWPSIPYCVPVMNQLYAMMRAVRFRWPVCNAAMRVVDSGMTRQITRSICGLGFW